MSVTPHLRPASPSVAPPAGGTLCLRPGVRSVVAGGVTHVGRGEIRPSWLRLAGRGIDRLLPLLDGRWTATELLQAVPEPSRPAVETLIDHLRRADLLETQALGTEADVEAAPSSSIERPNVETPFENQTFARAQRVSIGLQVDSAVEDLIVEALDRLGILVDPAPTAQDLDLLLVTSTTASRPTAPQLLVQLEAEDLRLGPFVLPGEGPCFDCFESRCRANRDAAFDGAALVHPERDDLPSPAALERAALYIAGTIERFLEAQTKGRVQELTGRVDDVHLGDGSQAVTTHRFLALPFCPTCGPTSGPDGLETRPEPPSVPGAEVFDPLCGIVKHFIEMDVEARDPKVFFFATEATDSTRLDPAVPDAARFGCGVDVDEAAARGAAMGEILERYSAAHYDPRRIRHGTYDELVADLGGAGERVVAPERFALFSKDQHGRFDARLQPLNRDTRTGWVEGRSLVDDRPVWVPAPLAFLPYRYGGDEAYLGECLSTGLACGRTRPSALLSGLCEVVERDAMAVTWYSRIVPRRLRLDPASELGRFYGEFLAVPEMELRLLDLTLDLGIPTVAAFLLHENGGTVVGISTRLDPVEAARKALLEAVQGALVWRDPLRHGPQKRFADDFHDVVDYADHPRAYMASEMRSRLDFLWSSSEQVELYDLPRPAAAEPADALATCVRRLAEHDLGSSLEPVAVDVTSPDVERLGYHVTRVLVPGAQPLGARHTAPYFGGSRLFDVPRRLGLTVPGQDDLNTDPHPFP